ncbi:hypothetical protein [Chryseobacterium sp. 22458]|uniref:hypothetical protein n=1 Tax=Chryseobacterium sp. 22458 TaxID=3453921 RepID=UPI003F84E750
MEKCDVSFKIGYRSSGTITDAYVKYKYPPDSLNEDIFDITNALLQNPDSIKLPNIQTSGTYNLEVGLKVNGVADTENATLIVGRCSSCETPKVYDVKVEENGQIVMNYEVINTGNLATLEYQIATDPSFEEQYIIYSKVGFSDKDYTQFENIDMRNGNIPDKTTLYIRIRKYCLSDGISGWSNFIRFDSGVWGVEAYCLSANSVRDINSLCHGIFPAWLLKVVVKPSPPGVGGTIYLTNGKPAIPENIRELEQNAPEDLKKSGIRWITFLRSDSEFNPSFIYRVQPEIAEIGGVEEEKCYY